MIRTHWDDAEEKWYFSIVDVVQVLTDSVDGRKYWNKLKQRLKAEGNQTVTNCHQLKMLASDGKMRKTDVADVEQLLRLVQSIDRALETYARKGYSREFLPPFLSVCGADQLRLHPAPEDCRAALRTSAQSASVQQSLCGKPLVGFILPSTAERKNFRVPFGHGIENDLVAVSVGKFGRYEHENDLERPPQNQLSSVANQECTWYNHIVKSMHSPARKPIASALVMRDFFSPEWRCTKVLGSCNGVCCFV